MKRTFIATALALLATVFTVAPSFAGEWVRLGERHVGFINDHDTIEVGRFEGRFKRLKLFVKDNDIELNTIKVIFANGEEEEVVFNEKIRAGHESQAVNFRTAWHEGRHIKAIRLHYHSRVDFRGEAVVEVWAKED